jgi:hypothetical protein
LLIDIALQTLVYARQSAIQEFVGYVVHYDRKAGSRGNLSDSVPHRSGTDYSD